jgi:hypothetical protein
MQLKNHKKYRIEFYHHTAHFGTTVFGWHLWQANTRYHPGIEHETIENMNQEIVDFLKSNNRLTGIIIDFNEIIIKPVKNR